ncbi:orotate phosphoribosyltransferase [bacterium]|nr:orotate phosphoribosyltransferase [bacterium]
MTLRELEEKVIEICRLEGEFLLRSGQTATHYFDKYRFEAQPTLLKPIAHFLKDLIPKDTEVLAGLEMGGIPIATALSLETNLPVIFVRKKAKEYGTCKIAEGLGSLQGKKVCVIEDVITTGGQVLLSTEDLRKEGALVSHVLCVILRNQEGVKKLSSANLHLSALFQPS